MLIFIIKSTKVMTGEHDKQNRHKNKSILVSWRHAPEELVSWRLAPGELVSRWPVHEELVALRLMSELSPEFR